MTTDLLSMATRELRARPIDSDRALLTLAKLRPARRSRARRLVALVIPIAATLVALGAWAGAAHERSRMRIAQARTEERVVARAVPQVPKGIAVLPLPTATATETAAPLPQLPPPVVVSKPATAIAITATVTVTTAPPPPPPPPVAPNTNALYRAAFEAYRDHDDANALAKWDAYLAAAGPTGQFVPEARYAKAATLLRLGRKSEAKEALAPFARGDFGSYRQNEARTLLERL